MNSLKVQEKQNRINFLKIQYAARVCFNDAEMYNCIAWGACIISAFSIFLPNDLNTSVVNGIPFAFDFIAVIFYAMACKSVSWGARFRKYFDANVIDIKPNQFSKDERQSITEKAESIFSTHPKDGVIQIGNTSHNTPPGVKDWYEFSMPLDGIDAQFECQRQNIWWNEKISKLKIPMVLFAGIFVAGTFGFLMHILDCSVLNTILCSSGIILKIIERLCENIKYIQVSQQIDGAKRIIEAKPEIEHIEQLQMLINERRELNVLESNSIHKKVAGKLALLYRKSS